MPQLHRLVIFGIMILAMVTGTRLQAASTDYRTDELLRVIDEEIKHSDRYAAVRFMAADSIKSLLDEHGELGSQERFELIRNHGYELSYVDSDSAQVVFRQGLEEAREADDTLWMERFMIDNALQCHVLGLNLESVGLLDHIRKMGVVPELAEEFGEAEIIVNCRLYELHANSAVRSRYIRRAVSSAENLLAKISPAKREQNQYKMYQALLARESNNKALLTALLHDVVESASEDSRDYSAAALMLGDYYRSIDRADDAINAYARGALADVRTGKFTGNSIIRLARELYDAGDISRAYNYITFALDQALRVGSKVNQMELSELLKPASDDYRRLENRRLILVILMAVILLVALGFILKMMFSLRREMKSLREMKQRLSAANEAKELYIGQYLSLCSTFLERLEDFSRTCRRKLTAGQTEDLLSFIKSGKTIEEQRSMFYDIFDDTFIHIYPTFVSEVNNLLLPDKRITVAGASSLTPELRILAFQRLGIDDTAKVARFLGLSLNTIYTYRNKLRSRAINRDTFDHDVMNIGIIS